MNNRFKFRVWDNKKEIWLDKTDFCIYNGDAQEVEVKSTEYLSNGASYNPLGFVENDTGGLYYNRDLIVQQYTGLNDKNGKEIYEGDIVQYNQNSSYDNMNFIAKWNNDNLGFIFQSNSGEELVNQSPHLNRFKHLEVVGNIFETPELLK